MVGEWQTVEFGDVLVEGTRNGLYKKKEFHGSGVKIVNMGELFAYPRLYAVPMNRLELTEVELQKSSLEPGDLLFARRSLIAEGAGKCSIVMEVDEPTTFESSIIRARPNRAKADSLFLYYLFSSPQGRYLLGTILRQVAVSGITGSDLVRLKISLPVLREQQSIAYILSVLDEKIELNRRMNQTLEAMARAIFKSWFVDFDPVRAKVEDRDPDLPKHIANLFPDSFEESELGEIPRTWKAGFLGEVAHNLRRCVQPDKIESASPYIGLEHIPRRCIALSEWGYAGELESNKFAFRRGEILFGKLRPYFHKVGVAPTSGVCSTDILVIVPKEECWFGFVLGYVSSTEFINYTDASSTGTKMPRTNWHDMARYRIPLPSKPLAEVFNVFVLPVIEQIIVNIHQSRTLAAIRNALLPKLISGQLRVPDAERIVGRCV